MKTSALKGCARSRILLALALLACPTFGSSGCMPPKKEAETTRLTWKLPVLSPLPETKVLQEKEGIQISVTPGTFEAAKVYEQQDKRVPDPLIKSQNVLYYFERRNIPHAVVKPDRLEFLVKLNNKMDRVFRGAGAVVSFQVSGKQVAVEQQNYAEFLNAIVTPRSELQVKVTGPALSSLPDECTVGIFFYDVVTDKDEAGNIKKRANFEWFYQHKTETKGTEEQVTPVLMQVNKP